MCTYLFFHYLLHIYAIVQNTIFYTFAYRIIVLRDLMLMLIKLDLSVLDPDR